MTETYGLQSTIDFDTYDRTCKIIHDYFKTLQSVQNDRRNAQLKHEVACINSPYPRWLFWHVYNVRSYEQDINSLASIRISEKSNMARD